ncbi:hypothetical protein AO268_23550 [Pseudomonas sp. ICMP 8385]|uniref:hypothetical protein n=1 Tax=Pseudomonas sp. ICMP 8385 TaxID=1718920 RepID=UPI000C07415F|nr:hypothetical protein [Pseudomonas sp. ICMP 8385]PHN53942.1 hypothetical protein AO268_23550 [Pseudomonas sp. ICMP 8385]
MPRKISKITGLSGHPAAPSMLKMADIAAQAGIALVSAGSVVPSMIYEASKLAAEKVHDYIRGRDNRRILEFHQQLLNCEGREGEKTFDGEIEDTNFHALLQACLSDIEDEKTTAYANLTRSIIEGRVKKELRRHYIISLRDIAWDHLDYLREAYVISNYSLFLPGNPKTIRVEGFLTKHHPGSGQHLAVTSLTAKGFVEGENLSQLGGDFVQACSTEDDLAPGAYGYRIWSNHKCEVLSLVDPMESSSVIDSIATALMEMGIKPLTGALEGSLNREDRNIHATCTIVVYRQGKVLDEVTLKNLIYRVGNQPVVQIIIDDDSIGPHAALFSSQNVVTNTVMTRSEAAEVVQLLANQILVKYPPRSNS